MARTHHVSVQVPLDELAACRAFYTEVLGLPEIPALAGIAWFLLADGGHVHLLSGDPPAASSLAHFALHVDDLQGVLARYRATGGEPKAGQDLWGAERWFIRDPAGNMIEVFEVGPDD